VFYKIHIHQLYCLNYYSDNINLIVFVLSTFSGPPNGYSKRFVGFSLYVSNTTDRTQGHLCVPDKNYTVDDIQPVLNVSCPVHGRYVIYYNERLSGVKYPDGYSTYAFTEPCEVEVYGMFMNTIVHIIRFAFSTKTTSLNY
jgi:hypothetical protein